MRNLFAMAQVTSEMNFEGEMDNPLLPRICISSRLGCFVEGHVDSSSSDMASTRSPSTSPARSRSATTGLATQRRASRPKFSSLDLPSRDPSQDGYRLYSGDDLRTGRSQWSGHEPRHVDLAHASEAFNTHRQTIESPQSDSLLHTPSTDASSRSRFVVSVSNDQNYINSC